MSLLLKLSLVIYAVLVTIYCFQKKFRSQRWLRIFSKMLCSVGFLLRVASILEITVPREFRSRHLRYRQ